MIVCSAESLAVELGISLPTVYRWIRRGMPRQQVGLGYRYDSEEILRWAAKISARHARFVENYRQGQL